MYVKEQGVMLIHHIDPKIRKVVNQLMYEYKVNPFDDSLYIEDKGGYIELWKPEEMIARRKKR